MLQKFLCSYLCKVITIKSFKQRVCMCTWYMCLPVIVFGARFCVMLISAYPVVWIQTICWKMKRWYLTFEQVSLLNVFVFLLTGDDVYHLISGDKILAGKYCTDLLCPVYTWRHNNNVIFVKISVYVSNWITVCTKLLFCFFYVLKINIIMPFCNLFMGQPS